MDADVGAKQQQKQQQKEGGKTAANSSALERGQADRAVWFISFLRHSHHLHPKRTSEEKVYFKDRTLGSSSVKIKHCQQSGTCSSMPKLTCCHCWLVSPSPCTGQLGSSPASCSSARRPTVRRLAAASAIDPAATAAVLALPLLVLCMAPRGCGALGGLLWVGGAGGAPSLLLLPLLKFPPFLRGVLTLVSSWELLWLLLSPGEEPMPTTLLPPPPLLLLDGEGVCPCPCMRR